MLQQQRGDIVPLMKHREPQRLAVKCIRRGSSLKQEAHSFEMAAVDGEGERQAAARVWVRARIEQETHQGDRTVQCGDAQRVIALIDCDAKREERSDEALERSGYPLAPQRAGSGVVRARGVSETSLHGGFQLKMFPQPKHLQKISPC